MQRRLVLAAFSCLATVVSVSAPSARADGEFSVVEGPWRIVEHAQDWWGIMEQVSGSGWPNDPTFVRLTLTVPDPPDFAIDVTGAAIFPVVGEGSFVAEGGVPGVGVTTYGFEAFLPDGDVLNVGGLEFHFTIDCNVNATNGDIVADMSVAVITHGESDGSGDPVEAFESDGCSNVEITRLGVVPGLRPQAVTLTALALVVTGLWAWRRRRLASVHLR